jgi:hypothetical protein
LTGNPVYPFLNRIFASPYWTGVADRHFHHALRRWEIADWGVATYLGLPLRLTLAPRLVDIHTGILPLVLLPLLFARGPRGAAVLKAYAGLFVVVWLFVQTEVRSMLSLFAVVFVLAGLALEAREWPAAGLRRAFAVLLGAAVAANLVITSVTAYYLFDPVRHFIGLESREDYLRRVAASYRTYAWLDASPDVKGVLLVDFYDPYYLTRPYLFSSFTDPPVAEVTTAGARTPGDIAAMLRARGVSHVAVHGPAFEKAHAGGLYSWGPEGRARFGEFLARHGRRVAEFGPEVVFRIEPGEAPGTP